VATSPQPSLGASLRTLRQSRQLSVRDVAEATGISSSFLSLVENGRSDITIGRLSRLVEFFGVSILDLLPDQPTADARIVRGNERRRLPSAETGVEVYLLVPDTQRSMMSMLLDFEPGAALAEYGRHPGEEWVHVLEGELLIEFEGDDPRTLAAGDSAYYSSTHPHLFKNADPERRLRLVCVDSPPNL
jgi:transcriptional regulator with XRE-family HTH domain